MKRRLLCLLLAVIMAVGCLAGCGRDNDGKNENDWPVTIGSVELYEPPMRVVCLSNNFIEIICEIGYSSQLVGRSYDCDYYQVSSLMPCGTAAQPSLDAIKTLEPDLILTDSTTPAGFFDELSTTDLIIMEDASNRSSLVRMYEELGSMMAGAVTGRAKGRAYIDNLLMQLDDIARLVYDEDEVSVCIILDDAVTTCATGDTLTEMLITMAGGFNAATDGSNEEFNVEDVEKADPEVLLCPKSALSSMYAKRSLQEISAMQNQQLYAFDVTLLDVQCTDMIEVVWRLAHILHPDVVTTDIMPEEFVDEVVEDNYIMTEEEYLAYLEEQNSDDSD